ncbi:Conserved_hypothetical protein [Hexamita inflata]|uniref:Uncharacterized protein n=1 Tax=Hexamita inflata TaxID=28002 RepID=A0AA86QCH3_9EUKA|nr:Conserved hypothetical protein [Hexamita inflata]
MGRPFTIRETEFSAALRQFLRLHTESPIETDFQLLSAFKAYPKALRLQLWSQVAATLNRTHVQVKNYFFNTWADRINASITDSEQQSQQELLSFQFYLENDRIESKVFFASSNAKNQTPKDEYMSNRNDSKIVLNTQQLDSEKQLDHESVPEPFFGLFD